MDSTAWKAGNDAWQAGRTAYTNPYWPKCDSKKDDTPEDERIQARFWVDGYVKAIQDDRSASQS